MKVAVLGATGMLGSMLVDYLKDYFDVVGVSRSEEINVQGYEHRYYKYPEGDIVKVVGDCCWVINAMGEIPQRKMKANHAHYYNINRYFPKLLSRCLGCKIIQIATDCVYSGVDSGVVNSKAGDYTEKDAFSPVDEYGESKLLGEIEAPNFYNIRCSIIGTNRLDDYSLLGWFLRQPNNEIIKGYNNHYWNGVTTLQFAKICQGIISTNTPLPNIHHLIPDDYLSKYELLQLFREQFNRKDITIKPVDSPTPLDRTLDTEHPAFNDRLWELAGYDERPLVEDMIEELAEYLKDKEF
jgi:dTDP-4-dehydrorhamnose reductase